MFLFDIFFPKFCIGCKKWGRYLCDHCKTDIQFLDSFICPVCNQSSFPELLHISCKKYSIISGVVSSMIYNRMAKKIVKSVKYQLVYDIYRELFEVITHSNNKIFLEFQKSHPYCYLQPIPLHSNRLKLRGFNQSQEIALFFSKQFNYPIIEALVRVRDTKPQAQIHNKKQRQENIQGAFRLKDNIDVVNKTIILVDDVYTSGSTCIEAARALKNYGVSAVFVWTLAHD